jgi:hypothetical protein
MENEIGIQASSHEGMHAKLRKLHNNAEPMGAAAKNVENKTKAAKKLVSSIAISLHNIDGKFEGERDEGRSLRITIQINSD